MSSESEGYFSQSNYAKQRSFKKRDTIYKTLFVQTRRALKKSGSNASEAEEQCVDPEPHRLKEK